MKRIGIMGGTFNPIHNGHLAIATAAYQQFSLEKVLFLPSKRPPHKKNLKLAADEDRSRMVKLAIAPYPFFEFSGIEMEREGYSYTADTLEVLGSEYHGCELCFIMGADSLHDMKEWYQPQKIFAHAHILCAPRYPNTKDEDYQCRKELMDQYGAVIDFIEMTPVNLSSKGFLRDFQAGKTVSDQIPEDVYAYIRNHSLYQAGCDFDEILKTLADVLPEKRYIHTIGVADTAACLSMRYGEDVKKARIAGLLHDCAKCLPDQEIYECCLDAGIGISETEKRQPFLLHSKLGAFYAKTRFDVGDDDILNAIIYHTTGRPNMSLLEKIIFLADYIEPGRKEIPGLSDIRELAFCDLDKAVYLTLKHTLSYLNSLDDGKKEIDSMTINAYNYYKENAERGTEK